MGKTAGSQFTDSLVNRVFQDFLGRVPAHCPLLGRLLIVPWLAGIWLCNPTLELAAVEYSIVDLGDLGTGYARSWSINQQGQVVGDALLAVSPGTYADRAVTWTASGISDLGTLGGQSSAAWDINSSGTVAGWANNASGYALPTVWLGGIATALPTLGGSQGWARGLNDYGVTVGNASLSSGLYYHAALWDGGKVNDLGTLGGTVSVAYDINNRGTVVGSAADILGRTRAVLWGNSGPLDLGGLSGGQWSAAREINDSGQVILWGDPAGVAQNRAAFWDGNPLSPVIDLGTLGGSQSWAYGLNNEGFVVGTAYEQNGTYHGFVWDGANMADLGTLGGYYSAAYGINDQGIIVGFALDELGDTHAVEWVPVSDFGSTALLLFSCLGVLWLYHQRAA